MMFKKSRNPKDNLNVIASQSRIRQDLFKFSIYWTALVSTCLIAFMISAAHMVVKPLQFQAPISSINDVFNPDINLTGEAISVDPISRTIVMNWYPLLRPVDCASNTSLVLDIFIPSTLLDTSSPSWTAMGNQSVVRLNSTAICLGLVQHYASFRTVTKLIASKEYLRVIEILQQSTFQSYPFDVYIAPFSFFTQNVETGLISALRVSESFGIAVNFEISLQYSFVDYNPIQENLTFYLRVERSMATKVFVILVAVTNWLTALAFLTIAASTIVYRPHKIYAEMFVVPVGALFAFSSIRSNLPGAPAGFGAAIDMYTILPVLVIMSLCSFSLLLTVLYRRICQEVIHQQDERHSDECNIVVEHEIESTTSIVKPEGLNIAQRPTPDVIDISVSTSSSSTYLPKQC